jgi:type I restriction enzyme S subunit
MTDLTQNAPILGSSARIPQGGRFLHNQRLGKIINLKTDHVLPGFVFYLFNAPSVRGQIKGSATGATVRHTAPSRIYDVTTLLPPLPIQRRIAGILSAYDELIENTQRRIKILEAMSRALYREWFVHFRFPGHESVPRVPSPLGDIPQGWEVASLGEHLAALESGKRPKGGIRDVEDGVPSIGAENINGIGQHDFAGEKFVPRTFFQEMRKGIVCDRDVAIYKDGAYIGKSSYFRDGFPHAECCVNEHVFLLRSSGVRLRQNALYLWLQEPDTVQTIRSKNANAAQPGINQQTVNGLVLALPDSKTAANFDRLVEPLFAEVINLAKRIQNLRRTRDLLLPRLLSGQIDVEAMPS